MIPKILQFFAERYPEIKVEFLKGSFMELLSGLESDDLDLLLFPPSIPPPDIKIIPLPGIHFIWRFPKTAETQFLQISAV